MTDRTKDGSLNDTDGGRQTDFSEGGESACWAHLVCPECGAMTTEGHLSGCSLSEKADDTPPTVRGARAG